MRSFHASDFPGDEYAQGYDDEEKVRLKPNQYTVILEKTERIRVVVNSKDASTAIQLAFEMERRGEADSIFDMATHVVECKSTAPIS